MRRNGRVLNRSEKVDFVLGLAGTSMAVGGLVAVMLAIFPLETGGGNRQIPVPPDTAVPMPNPGLWGGSMVLYGATGESRPDHGDLGCVLTTPSGSDKYRGIDTLGALDAGDRQVAGTTLRPLANITLSPRSTLRCSGPVARSGQPLYLLEERRRAVPRLIAGPLGLQSLAMGIGALAVLRSRRRGRSPLGPDPGATGVK